MTFLLGLSGVMSEIGIVGCEGYQHSVHLVSVKNEEKLGLE